LSFPVQVSPISPLAECIFHPTPIILIRGLSNGCPKHSVILCSIQPTFDNCGIVRPTILTKTLLYQAKGWPPLMNATTFSQGTSGSAIWSGAMTNPPFSPGDLMFSDTLFLACSGVPNGSKKWVLIVPQRRSLLPNIRLIHTASMAFPCHVFRTDL
jgi:hypothetical protein